MTTPVWDPAYEVLLDVMAGSQPVFFRANEADDIRRVLALADELGFRPLIVGGEEAWKVADQLAARGVPVLVSLALPEPDRRRRRRRKRRRRHRRRKSRSIPRRGGSVTASRPRARTPAGWRRQVLRWRSRAVPAAPTCSRVPVWRSRTGCPRRPRSAP